jgi:hypothetical protein
MTIKDWTGILFSTFALCISVLSFYFSNIRVEDNAIVRISDVLVNAGDKDDPGKQYINGFVTAQASFVNAGNRPAIILSASYQLSDRPNLSNGGFGSDVVTDPKTFPLVLPPRDMRLVELRIPVMEVLNNFESGLELRGEDADNRPGRRRFFAGFRVNSLDSQGVLHDSWTGMQLRVDVSKHGWEGLGRIGDSNFPLTKLFNN